MQSESAISPLVEILSPTAEQEPMLHRLHLGNLWQWILSICVVNFDLELGHGTERLI
jgi:hypothetical protein